MKFKWNNNLYKFKDDEFYIYGGENNLYISKIKDEKMIKILTAVIGDNAISQEKE